MIAYFDTSAFMKVFLAEPGSDNARALWDAARRSVSCRLLYPEARSALARALRSGRLPRGRQGEAIARLERLVEDLAWTETTERLARRAGHLAEALALRGGDAVHLAAAEALVDEETVFVTADEGQRAAAGRLGLATARLEP